MRKLGNTPYLKKIEKMMKYNYEMDKALIGEIKKSNKTHNKNISNKLVIPIDKTLITNKENIEYDSDNDIEEITDKITPKNDSLDEGTPYFQIKPKPSEFSQKSKTKKSKNPFVKIFTRKSENLAKVYPEEVYSINTDSPTSSIDSKIKIRDKTKRLPILTTRSLSNKSISSLESDVSSQKSLGGKRGRKSNKKTRKHRKK